MALSIKDPQADKLAREIAAITGEKLTQAVTVALQERLARVKTRQAGTSPKDKLSAVRDIVVEYQSIPASDKRSPIEIMDDMYDEQGLPK